MTQEDKELLLKDLCARLPYGVKCSTPTGGIFTLHMLNPNEQAYSGNGIAFDFGKTYDIEDFKPYLRPMSSMTEEEDKEWQYYKNKIAESCDELLEDKINQCHDFFNAHHLDFRNLIERGLAIEVNEDNNPYKE